jgi:hypothetical protein
MSGNYYSNLNRDQPNQE